MDVTNIFNSISQLLKKYTTKFFFSNSKKHHFNTQHYKNREVALLTQHGKEKVLAPLLYESIGCRVTRVDDYDTDLLGTFTRDIPRLSRQVDTARKKALIGMKYSNLSLGLASEGSFGPDPYTGMFSQNVEVLIWVDKESDLEVVAFSQGKTNLDHGLMRSWEDTETFARKIGFPEHHLVLRPQSEDNPNIRKGIDNWDDLQEAFTWAVERSENNTAFIETDMRAHANPTRMDNIRMAAEELAKKLSSTCPECTAPGYGIVDRLSGLPCSGCGLPTNEIRAEIYRCSHCGDKITVAREDKRYAYPGNCNYCNP